MRAYRPGGRTIPAGHLLAIGLFVLAAVAAPRAMAAEDKVLGQFQDWTAHTYVQDGAKTCSIYSRPETEEGDYSQRGSVWGFVTHRPTDDRIGEVSFAMGYQTKEGSTVKVTIGERTFRLFTDGEGAFARPEDDPKLIRMMRAGLTMVVQGTSSRGTLTTDTYSLRGFTNAHSAINRACAVD